MLKPIFECSGRFQWWSYTVSHGQLLLRSTKSRQRDTQVDVLFKDVVFVSIPTSLENIEILEADDADRPTGLELEKDRKIFVVRGTDFSGFVAAAVVLHAEGTGAHNDPSPLVPQFPPDEA